MRWTPGRISPNIEDRRSRGGGGFRRPIGRVPLGLGGILLLGVLEYFLQDRPAFALPWLDRRLGVPFDGIPGFGPDRNA